MSLGAVSAECREGKTGQRERLNKAAPRQLVFCIPLNSFPLKTVDYLSRIPQGQTKLQEPVPTIESGRLLSAALFILI